MDKLFTLNALYFTILATGGVIAHVFKKWVNKEIDVSIYAWFADNPRSTAAMLLAVYGSLVTGIAAGQINDINDLNQVMLVFVWGFAGNSALNKQ